MDRRVKPAMTAVYDAPALGKKPHFLAENKLIPALESGPILIAPRLI
jgi:hypothetical protein